MGKVSFRPTPFPYNGGKQPGVGKVVRHVGGEAVTTHRIGFKATRTCR
jgi:hypothetical protein